MKWNYRVVVEDSFIGICEVYYDDAGQPERHCSGGLGWFTDRDDMEESYKLMATAFEKPVLKYVDGILKEME